MKTSEHRRGRRGNPETIDPNILSVNRIIRRTTGLMLRDDRIQAGIIALFFAVGVAGHVFVPEWMEILTPPVLWVYGILVLILSALSVQSIPERARRRFLVWALITYLITFALEAIGTATGLVFGPYTYGNVLGLMLFSVPLVIGFNWVMVVLGAMRVVQRLPFWPAVVVAAIVTTAFDYLMEPVAIKLGYWSWHWKAFPRKTTLPGFSHRSARPWLFVCSSFVLQAVSRHTI